MWKGNSHAILIVKNLRELKKSAMSPVLNLWPSIKQLLGKQYEVHVVPEFQLKQVVVAFNFMVHWC